jgi:hypothetical protein
VHFTLKKCSSQKKDKRTIGDKGLDMLTQGMPRVLVVSEQNTQAALDNAVQIAPASAIRYDGNSYMPP